MSARTPRRSDRALALFGLMISTAGMARATSGWGLLGQAAFAGLFACHAGRVL
jgi:hypothetical protein